MQKKTLKVFSAVLFGAVILAGVLHSRQTDTPESANKDEYVSGPLEKYILKNQETFQSCFKTLKEKNPTAVGEIKLAWGIQQDGTADKVAVVLNESQNLELESCLSLKIMSLKFPEPPRANYFVERSFTIPPK